MWFKNIICYDKIELLLIDFLLKGYYLMKWNLKQSIFLYFKINILKEYDMFEMYRRKEFELKRVFLEFVM